MKSTTHKILYISILTFCFLFLKHIDVQAASASLSATDTEVTEGQKVTVTANVTAGAWNLKLSGAGKSETIYGYTQTNANSSDSKSITFTAGAPGTTYNFTLTGDMTDISASSSEAVNKSIKITVKSSSTNTPSNPDNSGNTGNTGETTAKSSEARLKTLGITPNDFSGFKKDQTQYTHEVPNQVSKVTVYAKPVSSKAKVTGTGSVTLKEGNNTINVTVTAENGAKKTYTINIKRLAATDTTPNENNSQANLKNLGIRPTNYDFKGFNKNTTTYNVNVPSTLEEIEVYAEAEDANAKITGIGKVTLKDGKNEIKVGVTSADGKVKKTYTINVTRSEEPTTSVDDEGTDGTENKVFGLSILNIKELSLNPEFEPEIYEYKIELTSDLSSLEIEAKSDDTDATIEIIGNENLQEGENTITILVKNVDTDEYATYQIIVNKNTQDSAIAGKVDWLKPNTWGTKEWIIFGVAVFLIVVITIAVILKIRLRKSKEEDLDLPGSEELDRALLEHQELADNGAYEDMQENQKYYDNKYVDYDNKEEFQDSNNALYPKYGYNEEEKIQYDKDDDYSKYNFDNGYNTKEDIGTYQDYDDEVDEAEGFFTRKNKGKGKHF